MHALDRVQLTLAVDPASDPITGTLADGRGHRIDFSGWLGFAAALEELLAPPPGAGVPPTGGVSLELG